MPTTPTQGTANVTPVIPGNPVNALAAGLSGGYIFNPVTAPGLLYVDPTGPASVTFNGTTLALQPGSAYYAIPGSTLPVSCASGSPNHQFVAVQWI
jgi:hypothetical protein